MNKITSAVNRFGILADFRSRFHGKVKTADVSIAFALEDERIATDAHLVGKCIISAGVQVDEKQHVEEGAADTNEKWR